MLIVCYSWCSFTTCWLFCGSFHLSCMPDFPFGMISVWPENTVPPCLDVGLLVMNWFCSSDSILIFCLHPWKGFRVNTEVWLVIFFSVLKIHIDFYPQALLWGSLIHCAFEGKCLFFPSLLYLLKAILFVSVFQKVSTMPCLRVYSRPPCPRVQPGSGHVLCLRFGVLTPWGQRADSGMGVWYPQQVLNLVLCRY